MEKDIIINLDALKKPSKKIIFLGSEFEIGYIPCGRSIPLLERFNEQLERQRDAELTPKSVLADNIDMVVFFCEGKLTREQIEKEATKEQVEAFYSTVVHAIVENYLPALEDGSENQEETNVVKKKKDSHASWTMHPVSMDSRTSTY